MASVFSRHESNRARLGRSRKTSWAANHPTNSQELERALWKSGTEYLLVINSLIDSMPQRCSPLLAVRGNHIPTENDFL
ncbi:hypothetical protein TNCV_1058911 [Trichonephila clavipes]|nr:hypothetical protein TNCV_1058911 [Trichonephila clavipes]